MTGRRPRNVPRVKPSHLKAAPAPALVPDFRDQASFKRWVQYWLKDPLSGFAEFGAYYLFRVLPIELCSSIGAARGRFQGNSKAKHDAQAREALKLVAPGISESEATQLLSRLHRNSGRALLETLIMDRIWASGRVSVVHPEYTDSLRNPAASQIFVSTHTSNLGDLLGICLMRVTGAQGMTVSRELPNRFRQRLSEKLRSKHGASVVKPGLKAARQLIDHLRTPGNVVLIHLDEARGKQVYFPTFGRPLPYGSNLSLAIRLSAVTKVPLVPVHLSRTDGAQFQLHVSEPLEIPRKHDDAQHIELAKQLDARFQAVIRAHLDDWQQLYFLRRDPAGA